MKQFREGLHKILDDIDADLRAANIMYGIGPYWHQELEIQLDKYLEELVKDVCKRIDPIVKEKNV